MSTLLTNTLADLLRAFTEVHVRFLVVGAYVLACHWLPGKSASRRDSGRCIGPPTLYLAV